MARRASCSYFYDHKGRGPQWLDDSWIYDMDTGNQENGPNPWRRLNGGSQDGQSSPHGRMSHTSLYHQGKFLLFGGDDGGHRNGEDKGYKGTYLSDLYGLHHVGTPCPPAPRGLQSLPPSGHLSAILRMMVRPACCVFTWRTVIVIPARLLRHRPPPWLPQLDVRLGSALSSRVAVAIVTLIRLLCRDD